MTKIGSVQKIMTFFDIFAEEKLSPNWSENLPLYVIYVFLVTPCICINNYVFAYIIFYIQIQIYFAERFFSFKKITRKHFIIRVKW